MKNLQTIYRLEYADGSGIYFRKRNSCCDLMEFDERHPIPEDDDLLMARMEQPIYLFHFGFNSMHQLRRWFYEDKILVALHRKGVVITEYQCQPKDVVEGHTQAVFMRKNSVAKVQHNILYYFNLDSA